MKAKQRYINNKGFSSIDVTVALIIIVMFTSIIASILYNIGLSTAASNRKAIALSYVIDIFEQVDNISYENTTQESVNSIIEELNVDEEYTVNSTVTLYNQTTGNTNKLNLIKIININIQYKVNNNNQTIEMSRLKTTKI